MLVAPNKLFVPMSKEALAPIVRAPLTVKLVEAVTAAEPASVRVLNVGEVEPAIDEVPLKLTIPAERENVPLVVNAPVMVVVFVPGVKVTLEPPIVNPPFRATAELPLLFQIPPPFKVTKPVNVFAPVELLIVNVLAFATELEPVTVKAKAGAVKVAALVPSPTLKLPPIVVAATVLVDAVP